MTPEEMNQITKTVSELLAQRAPVPTPAPTTWPAAQPPMMPAAAMSAPEPQGILLRASFPMPDGTEISGYLMFPPQAAAVLPQIVAAYHLTTYPPRQQGYGGNGYGRGQGGFGGGRGYSGRRW